MSAQKTKSTMSQRCPDAVILEHPSVDVRGQGHVNDCLTAGQRGGYSTPRERTQSDISTTIATFESLCSHQRRRTDTSADDDVFLTTTANIPPTDCSSQKRVSDVTTASDDSRSRTQIALFIPYYALNVHS